MKAWPRSEDSWAVLTGLTLVALGILPLAGIDALGWVVKTSMWVDASQALSPASKAYTGRLSGVVSLLLTYLFLLGLLSLGAWSLGLDLRRFAAAFSVVFAISYLCWFLGNNAYVAVTSPGEMKQLDLSWSLGLTDEAGFIFALLAGLIIGNFFPGL